MEPVTKAQLLKWEARAKPGDRFTYHIGFLLNDRAHSFMLGEKQYTIPNVTLNQTASLAWALYEEGAVTLVQYREAPYRYHYFVVKL